MPDFANKQRLSDYAVGIFENLPSRKSVKKAIKRGDIQVNNQVGTSGLWVQPGMQIELRSKSSSKKVYEFNLSVIYEDEFLAIVNKLAGLTTSGNQFKTLENALPFNIRKSNRSGAFDFPRPVHRLDRATSGLVLIAKTTKARARLGQMLESKLIAKKYQAIVCGTVEKDEGHIELSVADKSAKSTFKVLKRSGDNCYTFMELSPLTGRTHQLRIHCATQGWPILGDNQYSDGKGPGKGLFLSATALSFRHPATKETIDVKIDAPRKFERFMEKRF